MNKRTLILLALSVVILSPARLSAQIGLTVGTEYGIGAIVRGGSNQVQMELGGGVAPLFVFVDVIGGSDITKIYFPFAVGGKLSFAVTDEKDPNRLGVKGGITYNGILGVGFGGGADYVVSKSPDIIIAGCIMIFPQARNGIVEQINKDEGTSYDKDSLEGGLMEIQPHVSISVFF